ncbi:hypothetical protein [Cellulophaga sp. Hel_I_12]|uniref:hypothetical protein n=1 Tax=Cellulophaga sp. Hel_I_12 TaxID=1249972 RepID=UPI00068B086B|nr:hypothetical protein [Cellulophaga sp. Hel_I_12]|tara:strand:+ start:581 stop:763 length:183 start_codon:yes stop_codon:yes gene_type:complete
MAVQENQLSTWANQGSITTSSKTYESIKNCIDGLNWNPDISLQGSYKIQRISTATAMLIL